MKSCPKCALPVEQESACPGCGHELSAEAAAAVSQPDETAQPTPQPKRSWAGVVAVIVLAVCAGSLILLANARRTTTAAETAGGPKVEATPEPAGVAVNTAALNTAPVNVEPQRQVVAPEWTSRLLRTNRATVTGVIFELVANEDVSAWRRRVRPMLSVRCEGGTPEVFVLTHTAASFESKPRQHTVHVGFDSSAAGEQLWEHSVGHDALFAPNGREIVRQMTNAETMSFTFTPFNAAPATVQFNVSGLRAQMDSTKRCSGRS